MSLSGVSIYEGLEPDRLAHLRELGRALPADSPREPIGGLEVWGGYVVQAAEAEVVPVAEPTNPEAQI
jgi:hypothetical protein